MLIFAAAVIDACGKEQVVGGSGDEQCERLLDFSYAMLILLYWLWVDDLASLRQFTVEGLGEENVKYWDFTLNYSQGGIIIHVAMKYVLDWIKLILLHFKCEIAVCKML